MRTIIAITFSAGLAIASSAAFSAPPSQTPPPMQASAVKPVHPQATQPTTGCASYFPTFSQMDAKHQGAITQKEAEQIPALDRNFKKADTNHNKKLSEAEYNNWVEQQCGPGHP